ncbi:TetR/AcrR family transcriptional regulator [Halomonas cupida]|uniref:TetR family transcriptional regulator n=1 Tax=Halomonas cupida TaxID=44933 RepID=A0A1M7LKL3_9GAMM|nr:TetR/AcrR family transcriptional regulator [Halomonas cupida]GEN25274.1 TetR family transcriptional regulator [Halomonas cupida]SHM78681.1 transcriptional regulator, TetR family [Halomonas cupida]
MTNTSPARDLLIQVGKTMIAEQGYNATGINAVLKEAGVPKGSFYHYFASKEAFGLAVIESFAEENDQQLYGVLKDASRPALDRVSDWLAVSRGEMKRCDHSRGCLIGNLGQEMSSRSDVLRDALAQAFQRWEGCLADCLGEGQAEGSVRRDLDAGALAAFVMAGWQGALLRAKTVRDCQPLYEFEQTLMACIRTH